MRLRDWRAIGGFVLLVLAFVSCGGDSSRPTGTSTPPVTPATTLAAVTPTGPGVGPRPPGTPGGTGGVGGGGGGGGSQTEIPVCSGQLSVKADCDEPTGQCTNDTYTCSVMRATACKLGGGALKCVYCPGKLC